MPIIFLRKTFREARKILDGLCLRLDGKEASTNKTLIRKKNEDGMDELWWIANDETCPPIDSPRSKAYLRAYIEIGEPIFYGSGIPLQDGFMQPDRAVMKAMLKEGCVTIGLTRRGLFELTSKGRRLIADIDIVDAPGE